MKILVLVLVLDEVYLTPALLIYKSRILSQDKILHRQFVLLLLYTGNTLREEIIPKESLFFNR